MMPSRRVRFRPSPTPTMRAGTRYRYQADANASANANEDGDSDDEMAMLIDALHPVLQWDLEAVRWLLQLRERTPWLQSLVAATTSKVRTQDISLILWLVFFMMVPELGLAYLWIGIVNLLAVLLLQFFAQVLRPLDVDPSLRRLAACIDPDTFGFPCVDSHMAVVVLLPVIGNTSSLLAQTAFAFVGVYISATRLLLGTRFVSQVVGSWLTGLTGIIMGNHGHVVVKSYRLSSGCNTAAIIVTLALLMVVVGQWVENNDSRVLGVPKADFLQVLSNILRSNGAATTSESSVARVHQFPRSNEDEDEEEVLGKKDSFYYLLRSMRSRVRGTTPSPTPPTQLF